MATIIAQRNMIPVYTQTLSEQHRTSINSVKKNYGVNFTG